MTERQRTEEQPELLPGLVRATVKEAQAKARATKERKKAEAEITDVLPVARVLVDVRWPTSTGPSTTRCRPRWPRPPCRGRG